MLSVLNKPSLPSFDVCATLLKWTDGLERRRKSQLPSELGEVVCEPFLVLYFCFLLDVFMWNKLLLA